MNFTAEQPRFAQQLPRIAFVAALHVLGFVLIASAARHHIATPEQGPIIVDKLEPERPKPPEVTPPPQPKIPTEPPKVTIPRPEVEITPQPNEKTPTAETADKPRLPTPPHPGNGDGDPEVLPQRITPVPHAAPVTVAAVVDARNCAKPEYPAKSARLGDTGTVTLSMLIGIDGHVIDAKVDKSSGHKELDLAARQGLSLCKFKPGTIDGVPQQLWTKIQYAWEIEE